jgi:hypothetical protein
MQNLRFPFILQARWVNFKHGGSVHEGLQNRSEARLCVKKYLTKKHKNFKISKPRSQYLFLLCARMSQILQTLYENRLPSVHNMATNSVFVLLHGYKANFGKNGNLKMSTIQHKCHYLLPCHDFHEYLHTDPPCLEN